MSPLLIPTWRQSVFLISWVAVTQLISYFVGRSLPYSLYYEFDEDGWEIRVRKIQQQSAQALADIRYWKQDNNIDGLLFNKGSKICTGIISQRGSEYVEQTIGAMISRMTKSMEEKVNIAIYDVADPNSRKRDPPSVKDIVQEEDLKYPPHLNPNLFIGMPKGIRELIDYSLVLRDLYRKGCDYGLVMDDSIIAGKRWMQMIMRLIEDGGDQPNWIVVRLFSNFSDYQFVWWYPKDILLLLSLAAAGTLIAWSLTLLVIYFSTNEELENDKDGWLADISRPAIIIMVLLIVNFGLILVAVGKPHVAPVRKGLQELNLTGSNMSYANLFPRKSLLEYSDFLEEQLREARRFKGISDLPFHDHLLLYLKKQLEQRENEKYQILNYSPSLFQHIGLRRKIDEIRSLVLSYDFLDDEDMILFDVKEFLEL